MMQYKGYLGVVEFDADAGILHGRVVGIRDVITFQADAAAEVESEFRASVDDYLAFCAERGEDPDKPMSGQFVVRTDSTLHRQLADLAELSGQSLNSFVNELLSLGVDNARIQLKAVKPASRPRQPKASARKGSPTKRGRKRSLSDSAARS